MKYIFLLMLLMFASPCFGEDYTTNTDCEAAWLMEDLTSSCNSHTGTNGGATATSDCGWDGDCYDFESSEEDIITYDDVFTAGSTFSICLAIKPESWATASGDFPTMISKRDDFSGMEWQFLHYNGTNNCDGSVNQGIAFTYGNSNANAICSGFEPPTGQWTHLCYVRDGSSHFIYMNGGDEIGGSTFTHTDSATVPDTADLVRIGVLGDGNGGDPDQFFDGLIDDVLLFDSSLTQYEVENLYLHRLLGTKQANPLDVYLEMRNTLHTDTIYFPDGRDGYKFWVYHTPFPCEDCPNKDDDEHPFLARSNDMIDFTVTGVTNPLIDTTDSPDNNFFDADPDVLYIAELDKWFMVWASEISQSPIKSEINLAYSTDGKSWTEYDGTAINGNTNPTILFGEDSGCDDWEADGSPCGSNNSRVIYPSLIYESGKFTLFYGDSVEGNNNGDVGCATFNWVDATDDVSNFARCSSNPQITISADATYEKGTGHLDVTYQDSGNVRTYTITALRELVATANAGIVWKWSIDDDVTGSWTSDGLYISKGSSGSWNDTRLYRGGYLHTGLGEAMVVEDKKQFVYSAYRDATGAGGDGTTGVGIDDLPNWGTTDNTNYLKQAF